MKVLTDRIAVVTGGAQGIGRAIAERFQQAGASVCIVDRDAECGRATAIECTASLPDAPMTFLYADLEQICDIRSVSKAFQETHGNLNILVNNAGIEIDKPFEKFRPEDWDHLLSINLRAPFFFTQAMLPFFPDSGGAVVNISSIHATHAFPNSAAYACSKAAIVAMSRNLALELAPRHIRVNALCPGYIDTHLWDDYLRAASNPELVAEQTTALHPLGRRGTPLDVAQAALFLVEDASSFITGTQFVVDGGLTIRAHQ